MITATLAGPVTARIFAASLPFRRAAHRPCFYDLHRFTIGTVRAEYRDLRAHGYTPEQARVVVARLVGAGTDARFGVRP